MEKKLINLVREHEFLYNRKATYYKDLARKEEKWIEIAAELNIEVKKAKQRWKSLRDRFAREYGKMRSNGAETQEVAWKYFDSLLFLKDCTEPRERHAKQEVKTELNPKNINELFSTFLSENEESGQGTSGNRIQENNSTYQKNLPVLFKIERNVDCPEDDEYNKQQHHHHHQTKYLNNSTVSATTATATAHPENDEIPITVSRSQQSNASFQKDPILISFDNTTITAKPDGIAKADGGGRYVQTTTLSAVHPHIQVPPQQNETFIRSFFNAMAIQVEQANLNFHAWAAIQQEVMEVVNRNIIQSMQQQSNRLSTTFTQTANGTS